MGLTRYRAYVGNGRYKVKNPSYGDKGSFVLGVELTVTENLSAHTDVTCFDGSDGRIAVVASGGTAPYVYSLDQNFSTYNSTGEFTNLSVTGPVRLSEDQYGGILICTKTIYARDANGRIGHVDVQLQSPVELEWLNVENKTFYIPQGQDYVVMVRGVDFEEPYLSTTSNNAFVYNPSGYPFDNKYYPGSYTIQYHATNDCLDEELIICTFTITIVAEPSLSEDTSAHQDVTCFDGGNGSITVVANGGVSPYLYSIDGTNWQSSPTFSNLSITGPVTEGTDEYSGILICTKTVYVKDANDHTSNVDVQLKSPVELYWVNPPENMTVHCDAGQDYATLDVASMAVPSTRANNYYQALGGISATGRYNVNTTYNITFGCENDCGESDIHTFTITVIAEGNYGVTQFRCDDVVQCMSELAINTVSDYVDAVDNPQITDPAARPTVCVKTGTMTFNNETYYTYSASDVPYLIVIVPATYLFDNSKKIINCQNDLSDSIIPLYYLTANNLDVYKGWDCPVIGNPYRITRNLIDFTV